MGMLTIIMLLLVEFSQQAERLWRNSEHVTRTFESSRTAFDLLERDIQSMVATSSPNRQVKFEILSPDTADPSACLHFAIVSSQEPHAGSVTRYSEIIYRHHVSDTDPATKFVLQRQMVSDSNASDWNCVNPSPNWHVNTISSGVDSFQDVIQGVDEFEIMFFDGQNNLLGPGTYTTLPNRAVVNLVLFDEDLKDQPHTERFKTQRTFSKIFFLANLEDQ